MAKKYRVRTKCHRCGNIYTSNKKDGKSAPTQCKYCNSSKTYALEAYPV